MQSPRNSSPGRTAGCRAASQISNLWPATGCERDNAADLVKRFSQILQFLRNEANFLRRDDQHHADAEVERPSKIVFGNVAEVLKKVENRLLRPGICLNFHLAALGKDSRDVVGQAAAGDVGRSL